MENKTKKLFILNLTFFSISLACLLAVIFGSIWFEKKLTLEQNNLFLEQDKMNNLKDISSMLNDTKEKRDYLSALFVNKESVIDFLGMLEKIGDKTGAKISVVSVADDDKIGFVGANKLKLEVEGNWTQVFKTVYMLDNVPAVFYTKGMVLTKEGGDKGLKTKSFWQADIDGVILKNEK